MSAIEILRNRSQNPDIQKRTDPPQLDNSNPFANMGNRSNIQSRGNPQRNRRTEEPPNSFLNSREAYDRIV